MRAAPPFYGPSHARLGLDPRVILPKPAREGAEDRSLEYASTWPKKGLTFHTVSNISAGRDPWVQDNTLGRPQPVQADGEWIGQTPVTVELVPSDTLNHPGAGVIPSRVHTYNLLRIAYSEARRRNMQYVIHLNAKWYKRSCQSSRHGAPGALVVVCIVPCTMIGRAMRRLFCWGILPFAM
jgi:hypothetical protein